MVSKQTSEHTAIEPPEKKSVFVWDLLLRVFHWSLAIFFLLAYFLEEDSLRLHVHVGYTITLLVLFRLIWGVIGSENARFANFLAWPGESIRHLVHLL